MSRFCIRIQNIAHSASLNCFAVNHCDLSQDPFIFQRTNQFHRLHFSALDCRRLCDEFAPCRREKQAANSGKAQCVLFSFHAKINQYSNTRPEHEAGHARERRTRHRRVQCAPRKGIVYVSLRVLRFMLAKKLPKSPKTRLNKSTQLLMLSAEIETVAGQWTGKGREARGLCLICRLHAHRNHRSILLYNTP